MVLTEANSPAGVATALLSVVHGVEVGTLEASAAAGTVEVATAGSTVLVGLVHGVEVVGVSEAA